MPIEKEMIPEILRDLGALGKIGDAEQILDIGRDNKWTFRLLLIAYLIKGTTFHEISKIIEFGFSKERKDSLYYIFQFGKIRSNLSMPEKWFENEEEYINGSKNARSIPSRREDLFRKTELGYELESKNGADGIALILFTELLQAFLKTYGTSFNQIIENASQEEKSEKLFQRIFLLDDEGQKTWLFDKVQNIIESYPALSSISKTSRDEKDILPHIQLALLEKLRKHNHAFRQKPRKKKLLIEYEPIYLLSEHSDDGEKFSINKWLKNSLEYDQNNDTEMKPKKNPILLVGSAGSGKTFWMINKSVELWNQFIKDTYEDKHNRLIPIFLELGSVSFGKTKRGNTLLYGEKDPIWYVEDEPEEVSSGFLRDNTLGAMLEKSSQYIRKILERWEHQDIEFVIFLDGWDELGPLEKNELKRFILACIENEIHCIISSRSRDNHITNLVSDSFMIDKPDDENYVEYLRFRNMEDDFLGRISNWFPDLTPLDLEILGRVPKLEEIKQGRVPVYRTWIELQTLPSESRVSKLKSRTTLDKLMERELFEGIPLMKWIRERSNPSSVWNILTKTALLQRDGNNTRLSYDELIKENPLLENLLEKRYGSGDSPHPEISRNHLIPYLSAEYTFRKYLQGENVSFEGDIETFTFLVEILRYDSERRRLDSFPEYMVKLTSMEIAVMIHLESESRRLRFNTHPIELKPKFLSRNIMSTPMYTALFRAFIRYWNSSKNENIRYLILRHYTALLEKEINPENFIIPVLEIEEKLGNISYYNFKSDNASQDDLQIYDVEGFLKLSLDRSSIEKFLVKSLHQQPWLLPWVCRIVSDEFIPDIKGIAEKMSDEKVILDFVRVHTNDFSQMDKTWLEFLITNAKRLESVLLWDKTAIYIIQNQTSIDESEIGYLLEVMSKTHVNEHRKFGILNCLKRVKVKLSDKRIRDISKMILNGQLDLKYGIAIIIMQENADITVEQIIKTLKDTKSRRWVELLIPGLLREDYDDEKVNKEFVNLSLGTIEIFSNMRFNPWDEERVNELVEMWWSSNLTNVEDAIHIIMMISKERQDSNLGYIRYEGIDILKRVVKWLEKKQISTKKNFFEKLIKSNIDITDIHIRDHLYPIYEEIKDRIYLDNLLIKRYPEYLRGLPILPLSTESWAKHIDKIERSEILNWSKFMEIYLEEDNIQNIEEAIELFDEIIEETGFDSETSDTLIDWVRKRQIKDIAIFSLHILKLATQPQIHHHRLHSVKRRNLLESLNPLEEKAPNVYKYLLDIIKDSLEYPINYRMELSFVLEYIPPRDLINTIKPYYMKFSERGELIFPDVDKLMYRHGRKSDIDLLIRSLNTHPRNLGEIWDENPGLSKTIFEELTNPLSKIFFEIDKLGGYDMYFEYISDHPVIAEEHLIIFLKNNLIDQCYRFFEETDTLKAIARKYWKRIFKEKDSGGVDMLYLGYIFQGYDDEIIQHIANRIDQVYEERANQEDDYLDSWSGRSRSIKVLDIIQKENGYSGLKKILCYVEHPHSKEIVLHYLAKSAKSEGIPKKEIEKLETFQSLGREAKWHILQKFDDS
ncbi:MAG: hypothetical protein GF411_09195 [Candidatus Lokiarchaeota archaeon]|nr:hypothetical protein [Candidatus Lokiarchaeota archaeon]